MNTLPLVSIFIPAYNSAQFVQQTIESVLAQTYPNYELIIINDASTDSTAQVIEQYRGHPKISLYHNPLNLGVARNWNLGVSLCRGDFIIRLDADDFYAPDYLAKMMATFKQYPEVDMVFTGVNLLYQNGQITTVLPYSESWVSYGLDFLPDLLYTCHVRSPSACVRRSCYHRLGQIIEEMDIHEDWEFWVRITANGQIGYIAEPLVNIRLLNREGCTSQAIIHARSPIACTHWLDKLNRGLLPYQFDKSQLNRLKQGMYNQITAFAVLAMESGLTESVEKHLAFAQTLLPPGTTGSMQGRLYARAAEIYFMHGGNHRKGWQFLLRALRLGMTSTGQTPPLKLLARAILGRTMFEFIRIHTVMYRKFPYVRGGTGAVSRGHSPSQLHIRFG